MSFSGLLQKYIYARSKVPDNTLHFQTPLMTAVVSTHPVIVRILISHGANPNILGSSRNTNSLYRMLTPLHIAVEQCERYPTESFQCLQEILRSPMLDKQLQSTEGKGHAGQGKKHPAKHPQFEFSETSFKY